MIYHLEVEARFCKVEAILNGFPILSLNGINPAVFSTPINIALIGKDNQIKFIITPENPLDTESEYSIKGNIKEYEDFQMTGPDQGNVITSFSHEKKLAATLQFDNKDFDFSKLLLEGKQFDDLEIIKDYAERLQKQLINKNTGALSNEFTPKMIAYGEAYNVEPEVLIEEFVEYLNDDFFPNKPLLDFSRAEILARPWCEKRIWEIGVGLDYREFMTTTPDEDGFEYALRIFVGMIDGKLRVVR
ncbi:MAG: hypothetical protein R2764_17060 [Bacteroidales bacterium]